MAKSLVTDSGTIFIPSAKAQFRVQSQPSGLATTGVLMLVGEADAGADWSLESDLEENAFGPDQVSDVVAKYKSGPLVDAFRAATSAANDPDITGSFQSAILVKTNAGTKAQTNLPKIGGGTYAVLADKSYGKLGNQISWQTVAAQAEVLPTTGSFTYIPNVAALDYSIRVNGGSSVGGSLGANTQPNTFQSTIDGLAGVAATGGATRNLITAAGGRTVAIDAFPPGTTANTVLVTISTTWDNTPLVGDTFLIPSTAPALLRDPAGGATDENVGAYVITAATASTLTAVKLSDAGRAGAVAGVITAPADTAAPVALAAATDVQAFAPVTITLEAGAVIDGIGKALEIAELTTGTDLLSRTAYVLGTTTPVTWVSKLASPQLLTSGAEYQVTLNLARSSDLVQESVTAGGEIALKLGYDGTTGTVTITDTLLTTAVTGGSGTSLSLTLADYPTIQDLADYISSQPGYSASPGTASLGQLPPAILDNVTARGICGEHVTQPGRIKSDAYRFYNGVQASILAQLGVPPAQAGAGIPDVTTALAFLAGGAKGATTNANISAAITALESVRGNFLVPLFSRDATLDVADGLTDSGSTYTIASVHSLAKSHVLAMSTLKRGRNRQAFLSIADTFSNSRNTAANLASFRVSCAFQDFKQTDSNGDVQQYLPWMGAVLAAAMQAAGFYRNIEYKGVNTSGVVSRAGDFNAKSDGQMEQALQSGLLPARQALTGGFIFVSDQTTYGKDNNFVSNSIQACYAADTVSLTMAQRMETAFIGKSVADVSATIARSFAIGVLADMLSLKLIAPSDDDAEQGWKNLTIQISGNSMKVSVEIKLATAIDFILINFLVSPVQQSA